MADRTTPQVCYKQLFQRLETFPKHVIYATVGEIDESEIGNRLENSVFQLGQKNARDVKLVNAGESLH
nr:hypothetical protein BaRGS_025985 [Batillaria attramentaria]